MRQTSFSSAAPAAAPSSSHRSGDVLRSSKSSSALVSPYRERGDPMSSFSANATTSPQPQRKASSPSKGFFSILRRKQSSKEIAADTSQCFHSVSEQLVLTKIQYQVLAPSLTELWTAKREASEILFLVKKTSLLVFRIKESKATLT